jgi:hypothetical protein
MHERRVSRGCVSLIHATPFSGGMTSQGRRSLNAGVVSLVVFLFHDIFNTRPFPFYFSRTISLWH